MSILGKILLVFNLLAAGGFVYLATQDRQGRQNITAGMLRHGLLVKGLPLEGPDNFDEDGGVPFVVDMGGVPTDYVSQKLLAAYFAAAGAGSSPLAGNMVVTNQIAEVKRARAVVESTIASAEGNRAAAVGRFLLDQAETYQERAAIQAAVNANQGEQLAAMLAKKFDAVLSPPRPTDAGSLAGADEDGRIKSASELRSGPSADRSQREERIAHLLVHLDRDAGWQKRVMMVVGLKRYVKAVGAQALRFREMALYVQTQIEAENAAFGLQYGLLRDLAIKHTGMVNDAAATRRALEDQLTRDREFVAQRQTQLQYLGEQLRRVKAEVDELLVNQTNIEKVLYEIQREVGLTLDEVYKLEAELERKERERFGSK